MPTAKPRYDSGGRWKNRHYNEAEWEELKERLRKKLRGYYPDKNAEANPPFSHPADSWVNSLLAEANSAISMELWLRLRLTNEELRAERKDLLNTLNKADEWQHQRGTERAGALQLAVKHHDCQGFALPDRAWVHQRNKDGRETRRQTQTMLPIRFHPPAHSCQCQIGYPRQGGYP